MKEKNITNKEKVLEALMSDELDLEESFKIISGKKKKKKKDSLLMDSVLQNHHSTSYKEIQEDNSLRIGMLSNDVSKVNMTEDIESSKYLFRDKKKAKEKKLLNKLIDRSTFSHKKSRPKSSKGFRSNLNKVHTMNQFENKQSRKKPSYPGNITAGNRLKSRQGGKKKSNMLGKSQENLNF